MRLDRLLLAGKAVDGSPVTLFATVRTNFYKLYPESKRFLRSGQ